MYIVEALTLHPRAAEMMELFRSGKLLREIVVEIGVPLNTVRYWTKRIATADDEFARKLSRRSSMSPRACRNEANNSGILLGRDGVSRILSRLDVPTRDWLYAKAARADGDMPTAIVAAINAAYSADPAS